MALGISIPIVKDCPVTRGSQGVIEMKPDLIAEIAGAVQDDDEWLVLLIGNRSEDGMKVTVDRVRAVEQRRGTTEVEIEDVDIDFKDVVGVMHSHHKMGAFFSTTDKTKLNPRFPTSIVVAEARNPLGFSYEAIGKIKLPCGAIGRTEFVVSVAGVEDMSYEPVIGEDDPDDWGDCSKVTEKETKKELIEATDCGYEQKLPLPYRFGATGKALLEAVKKVTLPDRLPIKTASGGTSYYSPGKGLPPSKYNGGLKPGTQIFRRGDGKSMHCDICDSGPWEWLRKDYDGDYVCQQCWEWWEEYRTERGQSEDDMGQLEQFLTDVYN